MSTNFYLRNKVMFLASQQEQVFRQEKLDEIIDLICDLTRSPDIANDVRLMLENSVHVGCDLLHIGKRSMGWKPLFEKQEEFSSVRELREFYQKNINSYDIVDEYDRVLTWNELEEGLLNWNGERFHKDGTYLDEDGYEWSTHEFS